MSTIRSLLEKIQAPVEERGHLSNSQIGLLLRCGAQYEFRYIKGIKIPPPGAFIQGSSYHKGIEFGYQFKKSNKKEPQIMRVKEEADQLWNERIKAEGEIDWGGNPSQLKDEVMSLLDVYVARTMPLITPVEIEVRDELKVGDIPFVRVRDLILEDGSVIDHKLASNKYSENAKNNDLQSLAYTYPNGGKFNYHVALKKRKEIQIVDCSRTKDEVDWWVELVKKVAKQIQSGIFPPNPTGYFCSEKWCGWYHLCHERK